MGICGNNQDNTKRMRENEKVNNKIRNNYEEWNNNEEKRNEKVNNKKRKNYEEWNNNEEKRNKKVNNKKRNNYEEWNNNDQKENEKVNNKKRNNYEEWNNNEEKRNEKRNNEKKTNTDSPPPPLEPSNKKDTCFLDSSYYEGKSNDENKKNKNILDTLNQIQNFEDNNKKNFNINRNFYNINEMPETNKKNNKENQKEYENKINYPSFEKDNNYQNGKFESNIYNNQMNIGIQNDHLINKNCSYDIIIDIESIKNLNKTGWNIIYSGNEEDQRKMVEIEKKYIISVLGNSNRGKTYLLQKLCGENLESGYQIQTKGLSMKFHNDLIYLDTAGTNTPLLIEEGMKRPNETELQNIHLCQIITNYIIQTFVIDNADILICVVGMMNSAEQIFLKKMKKLCENKKDLYVIHNLIKCETLADVEKYKEDILLQMISVKLVEKRIPSTQNKFYIEEGNKHIKHFLFANDEKKNKEIDVYNKTTLDYIETLIKMGRKNQNNLFEKVINHIKNISSFVLQKEIIPKIENNLIKCEESIIPKDIKADELDNIIFIGKEFEPLHRYYSKGNYFIIEIQLCSKYDDKSLVVNHVLDRASKETRFSISGKRILNIKDDENNYLSNKRKNFKNFKIEFKLKLTDFGIGHINKEPETKKIKYGILFIIYKNL